MEGLAEVPTRHIAASVFAPLRKSFCPSNALEHVTLCLYLPREMKQKPASRPTEVFPIPPGVPLPRCFSTAAEPVRFVVRVLAEFPVGSWIRHVLATGGVCVCVVPLVQQSNPVHPCTSVGYVREVCTNRHYCHWSPIGLSAAFCCRQYVSIMCNTWNFGSKIYDECIER